MSGEGANFVDDQPPKMTAIAVRTARITERMLLL